VNVEVSGLVLAQQRYGRVAALQLQPANEHRAGSNACTSSDLGAWGHTKRGSTGAGGNRSSGQRQSREKVLRQAPGTVFEQKEAQRTFNDTQRRILWNASTGHKCGICHQTTFEEMHVDHVVPYSAGGATALADARTRSATCPRAPRPNGQTPTGSDAAASHLTQERDRLPGLCGALPVQDSLEMVVLMSPVPRDPTIPGYTSEVSRRYSVLASRPWRQFAGS
jgi:5-methylcytosine-specific restriction endonuclease McrA